jgi:hypothetical protein
VATFKHIFCLIVPPTPARLGNGQICQAPMYTSCLLWLHRLISRCRASDGEQGQRWSRCSLEDQRMMLYHFLPQRHNFLVFRYTTCRGNHTWNGCSLLPRYRHDAFFYAKGACLYHSTGESRFKCASPDNDTECIDVLAHRTTGCFTRASPRSLSLVHFVPLCRM